MGVKVTLSDNSELLLTAKVCIVAGDIPACADLEANPWALRVETNRVIGSFSNIERKKVRYKYNFLIRNTAPDYKERLEYGAAEVGVRYEQKGTKSLTEGFIRLPKTLKDMFDFLILKNQNDIEGIKVFGIIYSNLTMQSITDDQPHQYITKISRGK